MKKSAITKFINQVPEGKRELLFAETQEVKCDVCGKVKTYVNNDLVINCDCQFKDAVRENKKRQAERKVNYYFKRSLVNPEIKGASFENSDIQLDSQTITLNDKKAYQLAMNYIDNFNLGVEHTQTLLIQGGTGTGKSYLAYCIANRLKQQGYTVLFVDIVELLAMLRNTYNKGVNETEAEYMELIAKVDLLVLDDVGANKQTDWANEKLYDITNKRQGKNTIYTTNLQLDQLTSETDVMLKRSYSRMMNKTKIIKMFGKDRRMEGLE